MAKRNPIHTNPKAVAMKNVTIVNVDSTPEFICEECGYHTDSCVCARQKQTTVPQKPTTGLMLMSGGVAKLQTVQP